MLVTAAVARGVADGTVTVAFRRWERLRLRPGSRFVTAAGVLEVTTIDEVDAVTDADAAAAGVTPAALRKALDRPGTLYRIGLRHVGEDPRIALREDAALSDEDRAALTARLDAMDRRRPWTRETLALIAAHPGRRAGDLADLAGRERLAFKADVRRLKALGLTRSLTVGYELSPRGRAFLER